MGAAQFAVESGIKDVAKAFDDLHEAAAYEHGHGGYTGTIAEKHGYVVFPVPEGHTAESYAEFLAQADESEVPARLFEVYDDKWGPAVALQRAEGGWLFCGWASE